MQSRIITESELQSFNIYLQEEEKSKNTIEKYLRDVKNFIHFVGKSDITKETVIVSQTRALQPEEMIADDEKLSKCKDELKKLSAAKKVQTCDMLLAFLRENIEFIMLDVTKFEKLKKQLSVFVKVLDSSTRLLFAQNMMHCVL